MNPKSFDDTQTSETRHGVGNIHLVADIVHVDDQAVIQKYANADPAFRVLVTDALKAYKAHLALIDRLRNLIDTRAVRAELIADGFELVVVQHEEAFEQQSTEEAKLAAIRPLADQARHRLEAAVKGASDRIAARVIAEIEADVATIATVDDVFAKYGCEQTPLRRALLNAAARVRANMAKPLDLSHHYDQRTNLSQIFFPPSAPLVLDEAAPVPTPTPAPTVPPTTTLRTSAEVAAARA